LLHPQPAPVRESRTKRRSVIGYICVFTTTNDICSCLGVGRHVLKPPLPELSSSYNSCRRATLHSQSVDREQRFLGHHWVYILEQQPSYLGRDTIFLLHHHLIIFIWIPVCTTEWSSGRRKLVCVAFSINIYPIHHHRLSMCHCAIMTTAFHSR
jgi:hypothetical protein